MASTTVRSSAHRRWDRRHSVASESLLTAVAAILFGLCVLAMTTGCSTRRASITPVGASLAGEPRAPEAVEVLLDRAPGRSFVVVGELEARAIESPTSIEMMRAEAGRAGFDGIYWIECATPQSGKCTAKGFVYSTDDRDDDTVAIK